LGSAADRERAGAADAGIVLLRLWIALGSRLTIRSVSARCSPYR
jgi:hypothetical protein